MNASQEQTFMFQGMTLKELLFHFLLRASHHAKSLREAVDSDALNDVVIHASFPLNPNLASSCSEEMRSLPLKQAFHRLDCRYQMMANTVFSHSARLKMTEERFVDFVSSAEDECFWAMRIFDLVSISMFGVYKNSSYPDFRNPINPAHKLLQLRDIFLDTEKQKHVMPMPFDVIWNAAFDHVISLAALIQRRDKILKDTPPDLPLPPNFRTETDAPPTTDWLRRIKDAKLVKQQLDGVTKAGTFKSPRDIAADFGLPRKCEPSVRRYLRILQAKGRLPSTTPGKNFLLDNKDYEAAIPYLEKKMKHLIAKSRTQK